MRKSQWSNIPFSMVKYSFLRSEMASASCKHSSVRDTGAVARRGYVLGTSPMLQVVLLRTAAIMNTKFKKYLKRNVFGAMSLCFRGI
jgi:hypothetical protein